MNPLDSELAPPKPRARSPCSLWNYHHTVAALPKKPFTEDALMRQFEMAADHPARTPSPPDGPWD